jgi:hypothetical protein
MSETAPELIVRDRREDPVGPVAIDHIPNHSGGHRNIIGWTFHSYSDRSATSKWSAYASTDAGDAEVIAKDGDLCLSHPLDDCLHVFNVFCSQRTIQKHVVPMTGIEILNSGKLETSPFNRETHSAHFVYGPKRFGITRNSPWGVLASSRLIVPWIRNAPSKVINQMNEDVSTTSLTGKVVVFGRQHVAIQAQSELH